MLKSRIVHGDGFIEQSGVITAWELEQLKEDWVHWERNFNRIVLANQRTIQDIADRVQSWHMLCGITSILREYKAFDENFKKPKEG